MAPMMVILMAKLDPSFLDQSMARTENLLKAHQDELHRVSTARLNHSLGSKFINDCRSWLRLSLSMRHYRWMK